MQCKTKRKGQDNGVKDQKRRTGAEVRTQEVRW